MKRIIVVLLAVASSFSSVVAASDIPVHHQEAEAKSSSEWHTVPNGYEAAGGAPPPPGFYVQADTSLYPPSGQYGLTDPNYLGFDISNLLSTGLSILVGLVLLSFTVSFLSNVLAAVLDSQLVTDLLEKRSSVVELERSLGDADAVARITELIMEAYHNYQEKHE